MRRRAAFWLACIGVAYVGLEVFGFHRPLGDWAKHLVPESVLERLANSFGSITGNQESGKVDVVSLVDNKVQVWKKVPNLRFFLNDKMDVAGDDKDIDLGGSGVQETSDRPIFVLHIGPHKTASGSIKCELTYFQHLLQTHGKFAYLGKEYPECRDPNQNQNRFNVDTRKIIRCLERHSKRNPCNQTTEWQVWETILKSLRRAQLNAVISDEAFSRMRVTNDNLSLLFETIERQGFRLHLVMVYRHYFAWLLSQYNEHYKPKPNRRYKKWPGEGGTAVRPFVEYYSKTESEGQHGTHHSAAALGNYQLAADRLNLHPVAYLRQFWTQPNISSAVPKEVTIVDLHNINEDGIVVNFVRQAMSEPLAGEILKHKQKHSKEIPRKENPSLNLDYDMLATQARDMGLFPKHQKLPRRGVALYTGFALPRKYHGTMPHLCLSKSDIQQFKKRSLDLEGTVFPHINKERRGFHQSDYAKAIQQHKHCNLDAQKLLQDDQVQDFFRNIKVPS